MSKAGFEFKEIGREYFAAFQPAPAKRTMEAADDQYSARDLLRAELQASRAELKADFAELRADIRGMRGLIDAIMGKLDELDRRMSRGI